MPPSRRQIECLAGSQLDVDRRTPGRGRKRFDPRDGVGRIGVGDGCDGPRGVSNEGVLRVEAFYS
jgi:hypothetical protein